MIGTGNGTVFRQFRTAQLHKYRRRNFRELQRQLHRGRNRESDGLGDAAVDVWRLAGRMPLALIRAA